MNFKASCGRTENLLFDGLLLWKVCNVRAKKSCIVKNDFKNDFKNDISNLVNSHTSSRK